MLQFWEQLTDRSPQTKWGVIILLSIWLVAFAAVVTALFIVWERPSDAQPPISETTIPTIFLEPNTGFVGDTVTVRGQAWTPASTVLIYQAAPEDVAIPSYASASAVADAAGQFEVIVPITVDPSWASSTLVKIIAKTADSPITAQAFFSLIDPLDPPEDTPLPGDTPQYTATVTVDPTAPIEPTATPTLVVQQPIPVPQPQVAQAMAVTDLNIRSGPGTAYAVLGLLRTGQSAEVTGVSPDGGWWQIKFAGVPGERGWLAARYTTAQNTRNVPVVQPPTLPPVPDPGSVVITDWRGEYYNNVDLKGAASVVRNDVAINFDWGTGRPANNIGPDNFSVRWSRNLYFPAGPYRFYLRADDGVRLWLDEKLVIDQWRDGGATTYTVDLVLVDGAHKLKVEYYERSGDAIAQLNWELLETYPDWKGEYFNNPILSGSPVLVRNDLDIGFGWGPNSPGPGVPADNFSARWTRNLYFAAGTYRFKVLVDDGARLWLDNNLIIDQWRTGEPRSFTADVTLNSGQHHLRLEYFDYKYDAQVRLSWERADYFPDWKAEYFDNHRLQGNPVLVRNEGNIDHKWGSGSPGPGVPADNFSARWTREADFSNGTYRFQAKVDDGVRVWLDDKLIIDSWQDGTTRTIEGSGQVSGGRHRLKVEYYERGGEARIEITWQKVETPANQAPQAKPGGPYTVDEGSVLTLDGRESRDVDGTIVAYEWDFNYSNGVFGTDATGQMATTRYPDGPATMVVALRVTDNQGASHIATVPVVVQNVAPVVEAGGPYSGLVNQSINLVGTATDAGSIDQSGLTYRWEFGDGSEGSGPAVGHTYAQPGVYTAKLTVTDKDGAQSSDLATVQVNQVNQPPVANIAGPTQAMVNELLPFDGSGSKDSDGHIVSYQWNFGDGATASGVSASHSYSQAGLYQVSLTVTDNAGLVATAQHPVKVEQVENKAPSASISGPETAQIDQPVTFSGSNSDDPDGKIVEYRWEYGDGSSDSGVNVSHSYSKAGNYQLRLTVIDNQGLAAVAAHVIQIVEPKNEPPAASIIAPEIAWVGEVVVFDGAASSDDGQIETYVWDLGDNTLGSGISINHTYSLTGSYTVTLTVTDDEGLTANKVHSIQIDPSPIIKTSFKQPLS